MFPTGAGVLDQDWDVSCKVHGVSVSNFVKICCVEAEIWHKISYSTVDGSIWTGLVGSSTT